jgi:hypothetical protein
VHLKKWKCTFCKIKCVSVYIFFLVLREKKEKKKEKKEEENLLFT